MNKRNLLFLLTILLVLGLTFTAGPAISQDKPADTMQLVLEKMRADKKLLVATNLALTEAEANAFWPVYDAYQKDLSQLNERIMDLIKFYAETYQTMTDVGAQILVDAYMMIQIERVKLMESYLPKIREVLPEKKVARYFQLENKIRAALDYEIARNIPMVK
jgi:hypothetical protein